MTQQIKHTISVLVQQNFNALSRIVGLFSSRGYNIDSISFGMAEEQGMARLTLTTRGNEKVIEQISKQLNRIIDTIKVVDLTYEPFVNREMALIKVPVTASTRTEVMQMVNVFRGNIIGINPGSLIVEITGKEEKINAAVNMLKQFGIIEMARTGSVALKSENTGF